MIMHNTGGGFMETDDLLKKFDDVRNRDDLISFWNQYMRYGWKTQSGKLYRGIKKFDKNEYVVSSNRECIENGYYTCIEMTHIFANQFQKEGKNIHRLCLIAPDKKTIHCFATMQEKDSYYTYKRAYSGYKLYQNNNLEHLIYNYQIFEFMCCYGLNTSDCVQLYEYPEITIGMDYSSILTHIKTKGKRIK